MLRVSLLGIYGILYQGGAERREPFAGLSSNAFRLLDTMVEVHNRLLHLEWGQGNLYSTKPIPIKIRPNTTITQKPPPIDPLPVVQIAYIETEEESPRHLLLYMLYMQEKPVVLQLYFDKQF